jgi:predicted O-methyltransferase YrrM
MGLKMKWQKIRGFDWKGRAEAITKRLYARFLLRPGKFEYFQKQGIHVLPAHYSSPVPDFSDLRRNLARWNREWTLPGIDFNLPDQRKILGELKPYTFELTNLPSYKDLVSQRLGLGYGEVETHLLYCMIRLKKPRKIVEVGSGISTYISLLAAEKNKESLGRETQLVCIEPNPQRGLISLRDKYAMTILQQEVQDVPVSFFHKLEAGDVLFIDSSHVVRLDGDVIYLYLEVLPVLAPGVLIHIHDIAFPYLMPDPERWVFGSKQFWTEAAFVAALLQDNKRFSILLCTSYFHFRYPEELREVFLRYDKQKHFPTSLWLVKQ